MPLSVFSIFLWVIEWALKILNLNDIYFLLFSWVSVFVYVWAYVCLCSLRSIQCRLKPYYDFFLSFEAMCSLKFET